MTPKGVEHGSLARQWGDGSAVQKSVMPKGVEHHLEVITLIDGRRQVLRAEVSDAERR